MGLFGDDLSEKKLTGKKIAILSEDGFEQSELFEPKKALEAAGATVDIISSKKGEIKAWNHQDWGKSISVNFSLDQAKAENYQAIMLPGGVMNPDRLRMDKNAVNFVKEFIQAGKPIAAICHGPQTLIETGFLKGKKMTSWPSLKTDLINAGANWVDEEVVEDQGFVSSRKPEDLPAFNKKMIEVFSNTNTQAKTPHYGKENHI
jgi:protease I